MPQRERSALSKSNPARLAEPAGYVAAGTDNWMLAGVTAGAGAGAGLPVPGAGAGAGLPVPGAGAGAGEPVPGAGAGAGLPVPGAGAGAGEPVPGAGAGAGLPVPGAGAGAGLPVPGAGAGAGEPVGGFCDGPSSPPPPPQAATLATSVARAAMRRLIGKLIVRPLCTLCDTPSVSVWFDIFTSSFIAFSFDMARYYGSCFF